MILPESEQNKTGGDLQPFISEDYVSPVGEGRQVPILQDSGANESLMSSDVLPPLKFCSLCVKSLANEIRWFLMLQ